MKHDLVVHALGLATLLGAAGCIDLGDCPSEDPFPVESTCRRPDVRYEQPEKSVEADYTPGLGLRIQSDIAGRINVVPGTGDKISVAYVPYAIGYPEKESLARSDIDAYDVVTAEKVGDEILVHSNSGGGRSYLGADLTVSIPESFDGALFVDGGYDGSNIQTAPPMIDIDLGSAIATSTTASGSGIRLKGAAGLLDLDGFGDDIEASVTSWGASGEGNISSNYMTLTVPADAIGKLVMKTVSGGESLHASGVPEDWSEKDGVDGVFSTKTLTMGNGEGATVVADGLASVEVVVR